MLPLRLLVLPYESLSLSERAQALVLAREAAELAGRLFGPRTDRAAGALVWQRLVIEEALLRQVIGMAEAAALMRATQVDARSDPRRDAFLSSWADARASVPPVRALTVMDGGAARRRSTAARRAR